MKYGYIVAVLILAGCGADGEPIKPVANLAVGFGSGGAYASSSVGVRKGPVSISVGL